MKLLVILLIAVVIGVICFIYLQISDQDDAAAVVYVNTAAGEYRYYASIVCGLYVESCGLNGTYVILDSDGKGRCCLDDAAETAITKWKTKGAGITINMKESSIYGTVHNGIMMLNLGDGFTAVYTREGADITGMNIISPERLEECLKTIKDAPYGA